MARDTLLSGLRVVEIGQYIAAPFAATLLADEGADVVKIERPGGDPYRQYPERFAAWNRGKRTEVVDLHHPEGRQKAQDLIENADVVIENLKPGSLDRLGLELAHLRRTDHRLVTCSISGYGADGPDRDAPGWEPLVHARAGAQQGMFTADQPISVPFPMASIAAAFLAVIGVGAALVKRESTGYGQHVETSLLRAMLFLNAGAIFHRAGTRPRVMRRLTPPLLHAYETADGRYMQVNLSGTERWRELCRLLELEDDGGLDFADPRSLAKLADRAWSDDMRTRIADRFATRTADQWEAALLATPAAAAKCNTLAEWMDHPQARANGLFQNDLESRVAPPIRITSDGEGPTRHKRHGSEGGALAGIRVVDISSFWAGPLAARLLAEMGADVIKVEPPGGEGSYRLMAGLPNIYVDGNRSKRGLILDLSLDSDRRRFLDLVAAADVVVENAVAGTWERLGLDEPALRQANPTLIYARSKGFGLDGPLASRPSFDYVVAAATGMELTHANARPQPVNFTANDYGTGLHLAAGMVLALLGRARGRAVTTVEASLMMTATVWQSEQAGGADPSRDVFYEAKDGWLVLCPLTEEHRDTQRALPPNLTVEEAHQRLKNVPHAISVHPGAVPDDPQVQAGGMLTTTTHTVAGRVVQVGVSFRLSADMPAVRGPAPVPVPRRSKR